ncbi:MAG: DUF2935 domain-containing protein [Clostridiaceae bacterium]|nr:DUF2935 domain-containing protein [Clostridiaceae bacterium]
MIMVRYYYGNDQIFLRILEEIEFWKQQEAEHTTVIREIVPGLDSSSVEELQSFQRDFREIEQKAVQLMETVIRSQGQINQSMIQHIMEFVTYAMRESREFVQFLRNLLTAAPVVNNMVAKVVINHIIRESEYFIGIAQAIIYRR